MTDTETAPGVPDTDLPLDLLRYCEVGHLVALAKRHGLMVSLLKHGAVVRPMRNATEMQQALYHALNWRTAEVTDYLLAVRPHPFDTPYAARLVANGEDPQADAAAQRVAQVPHALLVAMTINAVNQWLFRFDHGHLGYDPIPARPRHALPEPLEPLEPPRKKAPRKERKPRTSDRVVQ